MICTAQLRLLQPTKQKAGISNQVYNKKQIDTFQKKRNASVINPPSFVLLLHPAGTLTFLLRSGHFPVKYQLMHPYLYSELQGFLQHYDGHTSSYWKSLFQDFQCLRSGIHSKSRNTGILQFPERFLFFFGVMKQKKEHFFHPDICQNSGHMRFEFPYPGLFPT